MQFNDQNFKQEVEGGEGIILVDFFAEWCGPCKLMSPILDELEVEYKNKKGIKIGKLDVDISKEVANKFNIMSIPTLILFKNGKIVEQITGVKNKEELQDLINKNI